LKQMDCLIIFWRVMLTCISVGCCAACLACDFQG
jgi:hypothetical protein